MFDDNFQLALVILVVVVLVFVFIVFFGFNNDITLQSESGFVPEKSLGNPHFYENPDVKIHAIHAPVFYLVSSDSGQTEANNRYENLKFDMEDMMADTAEFYAFQLRGAVSMTHSFHETPVYVEDEISDSDILLPDNENLPEPPDSVERSSFTVPTYIYEGDGIKELDGSLFVGTRIFSDGEHKSYNSTLFAHYMGRALGLPDLKRSSEDLMGLGRFKPINFVFLERDFLEGLGLTVKQEE